MNQQRGLDTRAKRTEWARLVSPQPKAPPRREWPKEKFMVIRPSRESATGWTHCPKAVRATSHLLLNEPGLALNVFWLPDSGRRACAVRGRKSACGRPVCHPGRTRHAGTRWVTERITSPAGEERIRINDRNDRNERTLDAVRPGPKRQRQLLRKERLADGDPFSLLTAHANGRPLCLIVILHAFLHSP